MRADFGHHNIREPCLMMMLIGERKPVINTADYIWLNPWCFEVREASRNICRAHGEPYDERNWHDAISVRKDCTQLEFKSAQSYFVAKALLLSRNVAALFAERKGNKFTLYIDIFRRRVTEICQIKLKCYTAAMCFIKRQGLNHFDIINAKPRALRQFKLLLRGPRLGFASISSYSCRVQRINQNNQANKPNGSGYDRDNVEMPCFRSDSRQYICSAARCCSSEGSG